MCRIILLFIIITACPAWASHPLITDDPGTVPLGMTQFEQIFNFDLVQGINLASTTFTFGVAGNTEAGINSGYGFGNIAGIVIPSLALKWRFIGNPDVGFASALSATTQFDVSPLISEQVLLLLSQYRVGHSTFLLNAGYSWIIDEPGHWDWGMAAEYDTSPYNTLAIEASDTDFIGNIPGFDRELQYLVGVIYTDRHGYTYSAGLGYIPAEETSNWLLTTGFTITY